MTMQTTVVAVNPTQEEAATRLPDVIVEECCDEPTCSQYATTFKAYCERYGHARQRVRYFREDLVADAARGTLM